MAAKKKSKGAGARKAARKPKRAVKAKVKAKAKPKPKVKARAKAKPKARAKARPKAQAKPARATARPPIPNGVGLITFHTDYASHNIDKVKRFYTEQLGFTHFSQDPSFNYLMIHTTHGSSLGFMPPAPEMGPSMPPASPRST